MSQVFFNDHNDTITLNHSLKGISKFFSAP